MNADPRWSYVQARLQARHGELPTEREWVALDAARSLEHFLDRTRAGALRRFTAPLDAAMGSHAIERALRQAWRDYVAETGAWVPAAWQPAVLWTGCIADLPAIDALLRGETQAWFRDDPVLAGFAQARASPAAERSPFAPLLPAPARAGTLGGRWHAHWRALLPAVDEGLERLDALVAAQLALLARAGPRQASGPLRRELAQQLARLFRRYGGAPVAVFAHLGLVALALERLRGAIVRRRLFAGAAEAA